MPDPTQPAAVLDRDRGSEPARDRPAVARAHRGADAPPTSRLRSWRIDIVSPVGAAAFVIGISLAMLQPSLPTLAVCVGLLAAAALAAVALPTARLLALPLLGFAWASLHGHWALDARIDPALVGDDVVVTGRVVGLPQPGERRIGFGFDVEAGEGAAAALAGRHLRLSWYGDAPVVEPGARWQLTVRLRRPRGVVNPGGFDYERHALQHRIAASGYVRERGENHELGAGEGIHALRARLSQSIADHVDAPARRFLQGLAVGDRRALDGDDWETLRATGLSHLLAISGLHIGMVAGFGALLARGMYWLFPGLGLRLPRPQGAALLALGGAAGYAALAGFGLPTQRALVMIGAVLLALLARRSLHPGQALALATLTVLALDPLAVLGAAFWLSFLGVVWLLLCLPAPEAGLRAHARGLVRAQWAMSLGLLPLTAWFFGQVSVAGALANLLAVPWVTFVVVPLTLVGTALLDVAPWLAGHVLGLAALAMQGLWSAASLLAAQPWAQAFVAEPSLPVLLLGLVGAAWLLLPRPLPGKPFALLMLLPVLSPALPRPPAGGWDLHVFDVGQGLALLVRAPGHDLLYDAGPAYRGGLDMGEAAVLPALRALGVHRLDTIVLSHHHDDHVGGAAALRRAYPQARVLAGEPVKSAAEPCIRDHAWRAGGVRFTVLHPTEHFPEFGNDSSCVLRVEGEGASLLLTGDIERIIEERLLRMDGGRLSATAIVVPHHGSHSSSTTAFLSAVSPQLALIGVGHGNRFGHPREEVLERYRQLGSAVVDTAGAGMITVRGHADGRIDVQQRRQTHRRFWHEP